MSALVPVGGGLYLLRSRGGRRSVSALVPGRSVLIPRSALVRGSALVPGGLLWSRRSALVPVGGGVCLLWSQGGLLRSQGEEGFVCFGPGVVCFGPRDLHWSGGSALVQGGLLWSRGGLFWSRGSTLVQWGLL